VPKPAVRPRRSLLGACRRWCHRAAVPVARAWLRLPRPGPRPPRVAPKVTILLLHAWGMGGATRTMLNVARWLAQRHEVEVLSLLRNKERPFFPFPPDVTVTAVDDRRPDVRPGRARRVLARLPPCLLAPGDHTSRRATLWTELELVRKVRASAPEVLIGTRASLNLFVAGAGGAPALVATEHIEFSAYRPAVQREIWQRYGRLDAVVVLAEPERAPFEELLRGAAPVHVIPNSVPAQRGGPARLDRSVVVAAGRLAPQKGFPALIRAFTWVAEAHPEWRLRICGKGRQRRALAALIEELRLGEHVTLAGAVRDIEAELEAASIFVLSSRVEGVPLALLEAMNKGLAVVSFDGAAGPRDLLDDGVDGLLVPARDELALARAICALIESERLRRRLGEAARRKAAGYRMEAIGPLWDALVAELVGRGGR
jgi:glycosyltransferase involved in cell wall biosynthesis